MLKIAILDEMSVEGEQIEGFLERICREEGINVDIDVYAGAKEFFRDNLDEQQYDVVYICINEKKDDLLKIVEKIHKKDDNVIVIFVYESDEAIKDIILFNVFAFIKVPMDEKFFTNVFLEVMNKIMSEKKYFVFHYKKEEFRILSRNILYFESKGRQIRVYTCDDITEVFNGKLNDVEMDLNRGKIPFIRIHQSFLVNHECIKSKSKTEVTLINGKKLPISESKRKIFDS